MELVPDDLGATLGRTVAIKLFVKEADPAAKDLFGFRGWVRLSGGDWLGLGGRHMCMDDKPRGLDAARVIGTARRDRGLF